MRSWLAAVAGFAFLSGCITAADPSPQNDLDRAAQASLKPLASEQQFQLSADNCLQNLDARNREQSQVWCALASRRAVSRLDAADLPLPQGSFRRELVVVRKALWMNAIDGLGLQKDPWWGVPRSESSPIDNPIRRMAYSMLANYTRGDIGGLDFVFERIGLAVDVVRIPSETLGQYRGRLLVRVDELPKLLTTPPGPNDVDWLRATSVLSLAVSDPADVQEAEAQSIAAWLGDVPTPVEALEGEDAALAPTWYLALGMAHTLAKDPAKADVALAKGAALCSRKLWDEAVLCRILHGASDHTANLSSSPIPADRIAARTLQRTFNPHRTP